MMYHLRFGDIINKTKVRNYGYFQKLFCRWIVFSEWPFHLNIGNILRYISGYVIVADEKIGKNILAVF